MADDARNASGTPAPTASHAGHSGGHVVSSRATAVGLMAIVLWSFMAGTVRIVAESFGATLGSALIYTVGGVLLLVFRRPAPIRECFMNRRFRFRSVWPLRPLRRWK